ncbi:MAG TPA: UDP-3-O-(3-hydroxymyristoyl)glucosamine N-acyltransferase [Kiritimatiellia bacterium]|nr:UDP-3-O-(3-hydroxymyristoyl)glucosamine N-acyltransferase [Kiritimatiellia bacterium]HRZ13005.1 UDP-3-O-(3-hydroxymyristoyl)glucosamine N-acyltransferase [Kiritimatiellia bacterium]HSA18385.1 UDP-3-O-(3-hydroxymyristoyl)glucosamine N-acyltransferase [Kiritimatiellia bacterium]
MSWTAAELAQRVGATVEGDGTVAITGVAGLREARPGQLSFLANMRYAPDAATTQASAVVVPKDWNRPCAAPCRLLARDPDKAFARIAIEYAPAPVSPPPGVHPTAVIAPDAKLGANVSIGPYVVIEPGASVGEGTVLFAGCYLGHGVRVGAACRFYPQVTVREGCRIGDRAILHNGVVIGSDGFGYTVNEKGVREKIPQIGIVELGHDVEIGANTTIDRARFGRTRIGNGVKIDNLVQIGHNVVIGDNAVIVAMVGISGSSEIGERTILAGQVGVVGHIVIGRDCIVGARSVVTKDIAPQSFVSGYPAIPHDEEKRLHAHIARLPEFKKKVAELEARLKALEARGA